VPDGHGSDDSGPKWLALPRPEEKTFQPEEEDSTRSLTVNQEKASSFGLNMLFGFEKTSVVEGRVFCEPVPEQRGPRKAGGVVGRVFCEPVPEQRGPR
jgi:hypothetical protein